METKKIENLAKDEAILFGKNTAKIVPNKKAKLLDSAQVIAATNQLAESLNHRRQQVSPLIQSIAGKEIKPSFDICMASSDYKP